MRRPLLRHVAASWRVRSAGGVRRSHEFLEQQLKLKQPHELPAHERPRPWSDEPMPWPARLAFGALSIAMAGALVYTAHRYYTRRPVAKQILSVHAFLPFTLASKEPVSANCSIFTLIPQKNPTSVGDPYERMWRSPVWSVQAKQPQLQIARSYTPLPPNKSFDPSDPVGCAIRLMIREEDRGEMSGYLHRLDLGTTVELRGPQLECPMPTDVDEIVFFAGGTGIAPALQVAHWLTCLPPGSMKAPRMQIVWSSRRREDCRGGVDDTPKLLTTGSWTKLFGALPATAPGRAQQQQSPVVQELERIKALYAGRLKIDYYVDEEHHIVDATTLRQYLATESADVATRKAVLVAGPEGYVAYMAGAKEWRNGREQQGALGGLLRGAVPGDWKVIKL